MIADECLFDRRDLYERLRRECCWVIISFVASANLMVYLSEFFVVSRLGERKRSRAAFSRTRTGEVSMLMVRTGFVVEKLIL